MPKPRFRSDIEGIRAIAILLVVGYHAHFRGFSGGFVGVDVFFVLSGYLITWLLVHEAEKTGTLNLREFYARRARRLLPAMAVVLVAVIIVGAVLYAPLEQTGFARSAAFTAAYLSNAFFASTATNYLGAPPDTNPLLHTWSLSVEEQFYLLWPLFVLFACGVRRGPFSLQRLLGWMAGVAAVSFAASWALTATHQPLAFFSSPTRAWEFAAGALGVLIPVRAGRSALVRTAVGGLGLVGLLAVAVGFGPATPFPGAAALLPVGATILVLRAGASGAPTLLSRILALRPLQEIGRLSYSWYLWHWPVLVFAGVLVPGETRFWTRLGLLALALALAEASYRLVEDPLRRNAWLSLRPRRSLGFAAVLTLATVSMSLAWGVTAGRWSRSPGQARFVEMQEDTPPDLADDRCEPGFYDSEVIECAFGPENAPRTAILIGDSHAAQWVSALKPIARQPGWRLVVMTKPACPVVDGSFRLVAIGRRYTECEQWRASALERIQELKPDLTVVGTYVEAQLTPEMWTTGTRSAFGALSEASTHVAVIEDTPAAGFDVPTCLAREAWHPRWLRSESCTIRPDPAKTAGAREAIRAAAQSFANVSMVDLNGALCHEGECATVVGGVGAFRDALHLTDTFAGSLSDEFLAALRRIPVAGLGPAAGPRAAAVR